MPRDDAERRMAAQATDEERREVATYVLDNAGDLDDLARQVDEIWADLAHRGAAAEPPRDATAEREPGITVTPRR